MFKFYARDLNTKSKTGKLCFIEQILYHWKGYWSAETLNQNFLLLSEMDIIDPMALFWSATDELSLVQGNIYPLITIAVAGYLVIILLQFVGAC